MPTTKTTITITDLQDAAGNLLGNAWLTVRLNAGGNAVEVDGVAVAKTAKVQTDADGDASIQLYPNEAFDVEDTFYTIAVDETSPLIYRTIRVPTGGGTYAWTADAIQVEAVPFDGPYPGGTTGSAGQVVARKSSGNGFELVNHNSIAGRSTADAHPMAAVSATGLTVPKASTIVAEWEATAPVFGASSERIAAMSAVLPYVVTRDGSTAAAAAQDQHALGLLALAEAEGARSDLAEGSVADGSIGTVKLAADAVTFAKMQNIATARILGRTTSGSGDVEELTAADVKTLLGALPNNLWAHQIIPWLHWKTSGGTAPTRTPSNSRFTGGYLNFTTVGTGHWVGRSVGLDAGTWDLTLIYDKATIYGVYDVSVDGVVVGSFNANGASATNQVFSIPGITVPANGNHTLRLTNTANGAGANTAGLALEAIGLQRTA